VLLPEPRTRAGQAGLAALLADPARALVAVDFDGTLAPIVERPAEARPAPGAVDALRTLAGRVGVVAVVSARAATDVVALGGLDAVPGLWVLGHYGLERWLDGRLDSPEVADAVGLARPLLAAIVAAAPDGVHLEDKHHSLVIHTRPAADGAAALSALTPGVRAVADEVGLEAVPGRLVIELRPRGIDKGTALYSLAVDRAAGAVVYVGDDLGDLPAFDAVDRLRGEGVAGLTVASVDPGVGDTPREPADRADLVLAGPVEVVGFLLDLAAAIGEP
jgi:trehalose 6-phosphate phosphatase